MNLTEVNDALNGYLNTLIATGTAITLIVLFYRRFISPVGRKMEALLDLSNAQLVANGGGNLVDKASRVPVIEKKLEEAAKQMAENHKEAEAHWKRLEDIINGVVAEVATIKGMLEKEKSA